MLDLKIPEHSYIFGLLAADGHLELSSQNRGKVRLGINDKDKNIVIKIQNILSSTKSTISYKNRNTNFGNINLVQLSIYGINFRNKLLEYGFISGSKSKIITVPNTEFSKRDFYRGIIDGDGSLGITAQNKPFISLVTTSPELVKHYIEYIKEIVGIEKTSKPNTRDKAYNICLYSEDAQKFIKHLYYDDCLAIDRKYESSKLVEKWIRPDTFKKRLYDVKRWSKEQDTFILNNSLEISMKKLNRTKKSIEIRLWRLNALTKA